MKATATLLSNIAKEDTECQIIPPVAKPRLTFSVPEAAAALGISRTLAYELARRGRLPVLRLGRRLVVPKAALERLLEEVGHE